MDDYIRHRIDMDPKVMVSKSVIRGSWVPVELIARMPAQGIVDSRILREHPHAQVARDAPVHEVFHP